MVAYSFAACFEDKVSALIKCQTVRGDRRRHARVGETVQLYTGMRTKQCRKLVDIDPLCISVEPIAIYTAQKCTEIVEAIYIDSQPLTRTGMYRFAEADGFPSDEMYSSRFHMGAFFVGKYGYGTFRGVLIKWAART